MTFEFKKFTFLRIYTGEDIMCGDRPLYKAIIHESRRLGLAGGTVIRAVAGYASKLRGVGRAVNYFVSGKSDAPIIVEIIDSREKIEKILPFLDKYAKNSLVTLKETNVMLTEYMRNRKQEYLQHEKEQEEYAAAHPAEADL